MGVKPSMKRTVNLTELRSGEGGVVIGVQGLSSSKQKQCETFLVSCAEESCGFIQRLMDLGLTPGTKVTVVKSAPLNGPLEILVRGSRIALGRCVASRIRVEVT
jgi:Fe2+ transport system protein FeoA